MRQIVKRLLGEPQITEEERVYMFLRDRGFVPSGIIDVGAYKGLWSKKARSIFGEVPTLMVEAQEKMEPNLKETIGDHGNWTYELALLASEAGRKVTFYEMSTASSMMAEKSDMAREEKQLETKTLDEITGNLPGDNLFLKIDVQGAELEVLGGAKETLKRAGLVQLETAILSYNEGAPTMREVIGFMEEHGFGPVDIAGQVRIRGILIQIDMVFAPKGSPLRPEFFEWKQYEN